MTFDECLNDMLEDLRVELADEFDRNFERGSFFGTQKWPRSTRPGAKSPLVDSGALRRSIRGRVAGNSVSFSSSLPYASIHNEGGTLTVTTRMKRYFWAKYIESAGKITRTRTGKASRSKRNARLSEKAAFCKAMALKKVGSRIVIPQRQFLGHHPSLEPKTKAVIERNITDFIKTTLPEGKAPVK